MNLNTPYTCTNAPARIVQINTPWFVAPWDRGARYSLKHIESRISTEAGITNSKGMLKRMEKKSAMHPIKTSSLVSMIPCQKRPLDINQAPLYD